MRIALLPMYGRMLVISAWLGLGCSAPDEIRPVTEGPSGSEGDGPEVLRCILPWQGDVQIGTALDDELLAITVDDNDHLLVAGYEAGVGGVENVDPVGDAHAIMRRYGGDGSMIWQHTIDTAGADVAEDVAVDPATGRIYILGRTNGSLEGFVNQGRFDGFVRTLNKDGTPLQTLQWGDERPQHPHKMALGLSGALTIAGYDDIYDPYNYVVAWEDAFVVQLAPVDVGSGSEHLGVHWRYQYQTEALDWLFGVAVDDNADIFVSGLHTSSQDVGPVTRKLSPDGTPGWVRHFSSLPFDEAYATGFSPQGDLYVVGSTFLVLGAQGFGQSDVFLASLDKSTGDIRWVAQAGWASSDGPTAMAFDAEGNVYVAGTTWEGGDHDVELFAMKFTASGELLDTWRHGTPMNDWIRGAAVDSCGRMFVVGNTDGALTDAPNAGGRDGFLVMVDF